MTGREAYIVLNMLPGIGPVRVRKMLDAFGSAAAILEQPAGRLVRAGGIGAKLAALIADWRNLADLDEELQLTERAGVQLICWEDPEYPDILREIPDPPLCLYVRGQLAALGDCGQRGLAIVGSRRCTRYGETMATRLAAAAAQAGWIVVSGLARGIDTAAHRAALDVQGRSIAVVGGGLGRLYPPENVELARALAAAGAVVSEQPMMMPPDRRTFPMRNRIIAGLCLGTIVVEAGEKSGAMTTANLAADQGRQVFAVPGRADLPTSRGCHSLIRTGAKLTESLADVMDEFSWLPGFERETAEEQLLLDFELDLNPDEQRVVEWLQEAGDASVDEIVEAVGEPVQSVLTLLVGLELKRVVDQLPGKRFMLRDSAK